MINRFEIAANYVIFPVLRFPNPGRPGQSHLIGFILAKAVFPTPPQGGAKKKAVFCTRNACKTPQKNLSPFPFWQGGRGMGFIDGKCTWNLDTFALPLPIPGIYLPPS
jgi:hypothetical protein